KVERSWPEGQRVHDATSGCGCQKRRRAPTLPAVLEPRAGRGIIVRFSPRGRHMADRRTTTLFAVQRVHWNFADSDLWYDRPDRLDLGEYGIELYACQATPVQTFLTQAAAEAAARQLDAQERARVNPFDYGGDGTHLADYSSLTPAEFRRRLEAVGLTPPVLHRIGRAPAGTPGWGGETESEAMTPGQKAARIPRPDPGPVCGVGTLEVPLTGTASSDQASLYALEKVSWDVESHAEVRLGEGVALPPGTRLNPFRPGRAALPLYRRTAEGGVAVRVFA